jgi:hypothetical protein
VDKKTLQDQDFISKEDAMSEEQFINGILWVFLVVGGLIGIFIAVSLVALAGEKLYRWARGY